jgi:hypothetical protein
MRVAARGCTQGRRQVEGLLAKTKEKSLSQLCEAMLLRRKKRRLEKTRGMETRFARLDAGSGDFDTRSENKEGFRFRVFSAEGFL